MKLYAHKSGVEIKAEANTILSAKREASKWMSHGGGSVSVLDDNGNPICTREFWETGNSFGWDKWQNR